MKITDFSEKVAKVEGKTTKRGINLPIAQIKEVLNKADKLLDGKLYKLIREA